MAFITPQGRTSTSLSEINVTPLVDVMLVLLIIFMVTAPIIQSGIEVQLPETRTVQESNPQERIVLSISREGSLFYGTQPQPINLASLPEHLKRDAQGPKEAIFLRADRDVKWMSIVTVIDAIRQAGYTEIKLVTRPFREPARKR